MERSSTKQSKSTVGKSMETWTDEQVVEYIITNKIEWLGFWSEFRQIVKNYHPLKEMVLYDVLGLEQFGQFCDDELGVELDYERLSERDGLDVFELAIEWIDGMAAALQIEDFESNLIEYWPPQLLQLYGITPKDTPQWRDITQLLEIRIGQK